MEADDESFEDRRRRKEDDREGSSIVTPHSQAITTYPFQAGSIHADQGEKEGPASSPRLTAGMPPPTMATPHQRDLVERNSPPRRPVSHPHAVNIHRGIVNPTGCGHSSDPTRPAGVPSTPAICPAPQASYKEIAPRTKAKKGLSVPRPGRARRSPPGPSYLFQAFNADRVAYVSTRCRGSLCRRPLSWFVVMTWPSPVHPHSSGSCKDHPPRATSRSCPPTGALKPGLLDHRTAALPAKNGFLEPGSKGLPPRPE